MISQAPVLKQLQHRIELLKKERTRLMVRLAEFSWLVPLPSESNFVLIQVRVPSGVCLLPSTEYMRDVCLSCGQTCL